MDRTDQTISELKALFRDRLRDSVNDLDAAVGRFEALANAAPDAVLVVDVDSIIIYSNNRAATLFGYESHEDLLGTSITAFMPPKFRAAHLIGMLRFITNGESRILGKVIEVPYLCKNGDIKKAAMSLSAWRSSAEGGRWYFVAFLRSDVEPISVEELVGTRVDVASDLISPPAPPVERV